MITNNSVSNIVIYVRVYLLVHPAERLLPFPLEDLLLELPHVQELCSFAQPVPIEPTAAHDDALGRVADGRLPMAH